MYSENVSELILGRRNKQNAHTSTVDVESTVKVHHPVLRESSGDGLLNLGPLNDEISKRLRLDGRPTSKFNGVSAKIESPLNDVAVGLFVVENVPQGELSDHDDLVILKVVAELARRNQDGVQQLLDLRIMSLGLIKDLADEVYQMLHLIGVPGHFAFDHNGCADDARSGSDVDQESFVWPWHHHDQRLC